MPEVKPEIKPEVATDVTTDAADAADATDDDRHPLDDPAAKHVSGEYAEKGDYHRQLDKRWRFYPIYVEKMRRVRGYLDALPRDTRIVDLGCGEGLLVEEYRAKGYAIEGLDFNYASAHVRQGDITALPYDSGTFDRALALDVIEHLDFAQQEQALAEIAGVVKDHGRALLSLPNLAHLASRLSFLVTGRLVRTSSIDRHKGDRPLAEYFELIERAGLEVIDQKGIFPTTPLLSLATYLAPGRSLPLHRLANALPVPLSLCFLALVEVQKQR